MPAVTTINPNDPTGVGAANNATMQGAQSTAVGASGAAQNGASNATIPYEVPGQITPIIKPKATKETLQQGSNDVMAVAQNTALAGVNRPNSTMAQVQSGVQGLLKNPMGANYDAQKYQQNQLEQFDRNRAQAMAAFQQQSADIANTGVNREAAYNFAMQGAQGRTDLESKLAKEQSDTERLAMLDALKLGTTTEQAQSGLDNDAFKRLIDARGAYEGEAGRAAVKEENALDRTFKLEYLAADQVGQKDIAELQGKIQSGQQLSDRDFKATQAALDRAQQLSVQKGDIQGQADIAKLRGEIDAQAQEAQQKWQTTERTASEGWKTGERLGEQDYTDIARYLDQQNKVALQDGDIAGQVTIADMKIKNDLEMQTRDMSQQEKLLWIKDDIDTARANGDVERQQKLIEYQTTQDLTKMVAAGQIDDAKAYVEQQYKIALQNNDATHVAALQKSKLDFEETENGKNRVLETTRVSLEAAGVDMKKMQVQYDLLAAEVEAGRADPKTLTDFVSGVAGKAGVKITAPDPMATSKAAQKKYDDMLYQYSLTHPAAVVYRAAKAFDWNNGKSYKVGDVIEDPATIKDLQANEPSVLNRDVSPTASAKEFNEFFNSTTYGELTKEEKDAKSVAGYLTDPVDLKSSASGDKFNFAEPQTIELAQRPRTVGDIGMNTGTSTSGGGSATLPAGKYRIESRATTAGQEFLGTLRDLTETYAVGEDGKEYLIKYDVGKTRGNIISGLWAGQ